MESQAYLNLLAERPESEKQLRLLYKRYGDPTEELHAAYDPWLENMAGRKGNVLVPFDLDLEAHPEQSIWLPMSAAHDRWSIVPDFIYFRQFEKVMARTMGQIALRKLVGEIKQKPASANDPTPLHTKLLRNQREGKNTLIATSHHKFQEMGYFRGARILAKRDRNVHSSGVIFNNLMTRQGVEGEGSDEPTPLTDMFLPTGYIIYTCPKSASSDKYGVPLEAKNLGNALASLVLGPLLQKGGQEIDIALAGSEIKPMEDEKTHKPYLAVPDVDPASAQLLEKFDEVITATVIEDPNSHELVMKISDIYDINELRRSQTGAQIVDMLYKNDIVPAVEEITKLEVNYNPIAKAA